jgi:hypothetical protein
MFTITNKLRTVVALGAVGAALASSGVASAATAVHTTGSTLAPVSTKVTVALSTTEGHSTGDPGSATEGTCQALGAEAAGYENQGTNLAKAGDLEGAADAYDAATSIENAGMDEGCFFID